MVFVFCEFCHTFVCVFRKTMASQSLLWRLFIKLHIFPVHKIRCEEEEADDDEDERMKSTFSFAESIKTPIGMS